MGEGDGAIWGICAPILTATWFVLTDSFKDLKSIPVSVLLAGTWHQWIYMRQNEVGCKLWSCTCMLTVNFSQWLPVHRFFLHAVCTVHWTGCSACSTSISAFHEKCSLCQCYFSSQNDRVGTQHWPKETLLMSCRHHHAPHWYKHHGWLGVKTTSFCLMSPDVKVY